MWAGQMGFTVQASRVTILAAPSLLWVAPRVGECTASACCAEAPGAMTRYAALLRFRFGVEQGDDVPCAVRNPENLDAIVNQPIEHNVPTHGKATDACA